MGLFPGSVASEEALIPNVTKITTTDATATVIWDQVVPANTTMVVELTLVGRTATSTTIGAWTRTYVYDRLNTGNVEVATASVAWDESYYSNSLTIAGPTQAVNTATQKAQLKVTGLAGTTIYWKAYTRVVVI